MKITIKSDVFNIFKRIKQINNNFYLIFNTINKKYEIYEKNNPYVIFTLPHKCLDDTVLIYVRKMLNTSNEEIINEIEQHNERLNKQIEEKIICDSLTSAERVLKRS